MSPCSPMATKVEHFFQKNWFTKTHISKNVHLGFSSNFAKINFNICVKFSICKTRGLLPRFKMASMFKMATKNWFFGYNSVNIEYFYVLSFALSKLSATTYFMEEKFFVRFKMAFFVQDGRQFSNGCNSGPNEYFFVLSFALCLDFEKEKIVEEVF